ncbi:MAG: hypothetical protein QXL15_03600 [Candidatus Korarchaeota archaeon]
MIYGEDACGKTTFVMKLVERSKLPATIVYTEDQSFLSKFNISGMTLYTASDFESQGNLLNWIFPPQDSIFVIDSISKNCAKALANGEDPAYLNRELFRQIALVRSITKRRNLVSIVVNQIRVGEKDHTGTLFERPFGGEQTMNFFDLVLRFSRHEKGLTKVDVEKGDLNISNKVIKILDMSKL